jgi:hypothetical protein
MTPRATSSTLLARLLLAAGALHATTACGGETDDSGGQGGAAGSATAGSSGSSGQGGDAGAGGAGAGGAGAGGAEPWASLPVLPADSSSCGPDQTTPTGGGYYGSCCRGVVCQAPEEDTGLCADASTVRRGTGSGTCSCGTTTGPFQADAAHAELAAEGKGCCYVAGMITCEGRPLFVAGRQRFAGLRAQLAWG